MPDRPSAHRAWLQSLGFNDEDWRRIRALADEVTRERSPPALTDLSVHLVVAALPFETRLAGSTKRLGVITRADGSKVVLIYWDLPEFEVWKRGR